MNQPTIDRDCIQTALTDSSISNSALILILELPLHYAVGVWFKSALDDMTATLSDRVSQRSLIRGLTALESAGYIEIRRNGGRRNANEYRLLPERFNPPVNDINVN